MSLAMAQNEREREPDRDGDKERRRKWQRQVERQVKSAILNRFCVVFGNRLLAFRWPSQLANMHDGALWHFLQLMTCTPLPVVWSDDGPVELDGVLPVWRVQSNLSVLDCVHPCMPLSNVVGPLHAVHRAHHQKEWANLTTVWPILLILLL